MPTLQEAQEALQRAQDELKKAQVEAAALKAEESLKEADRALWELCVTAGWPQDLQHLYKQFETDTRDGLAVICFGAEDRVKSLNALDPERWPLECEDRYHYTTDESTIHSVATAMFDDLGWHGGQPFCEGREQDVESWEKRLVESLGTDLAIKCLKAWEAGQHDT